MARTSEGAGARVFVESPLLRLLTVVAFCAAGAMCGCGGGDKEGKPSAGGSPETPGATPAPYPATLSASSSPEQVAAVLIKALDEDDGATLLGLVAVETANAEVEAIFQKHGKTSKIKRGNVAALAASGWKATYSFFEPGETHVTGHEIDGDTATVHATGRNGEGSPTTLQINLVREDGLWKVKPGLESRGPSS